MTFVFSEGLFGEHGSLLEHLSYQKCGKQTQISFVSLFCHSFFMCVAKSMLMFSGLFQCVKVFLRVFLVCIDLFSNICRIISAKSIPKSSWRVSFVSLFLCKYRQISFDRHKSFFYLFFGIRMSLFTHLFSIYIERDKKICLF